MKTKHAKVLEKQQSLYEAEVRVSERQLMNKHESLKKEKAMRRNAQQKLDKTKRELAKVQRALAKVQNFANMLEESNNDLRDELKQALFEKRCASSLTTKAKQLASDRLEKWHIERERRRDAEDEVARLDKLSKQMDQIIEENRLEIELSKKSKASPEEGMGQ